MQKSYWLFLIVWAGLGMLFYAVPAHAQITKQTNKPKPTINVKQNPFDFVQAIVENDVRYKQKRGLTSVVQNRSKSKVGPSLRYYKKHGASPKNTQATYNLLVQQYGPPKSIRGKTHVWDIENPGKSATQADVVTVILKMEKSGAYELIMDRDRGENGKKTWDATRLEKANAVKAKRQKLNLQLILKPDND